MRKIRTDSIKNENWRLLHNIIRTAKSSWGGVGDDVRAWWRSVLGETRSELLWFEAVRLVWNFNDIFVAKRINSQAVLNKLQKKKLPKSIEKRPLEFRPLISLTAFIVNQNDIRFHFWFRYFIEQRSVFGGMYQYIYINIYRCRRVLIGYCLSVAGSIQPYRFL